MSRDQMDVEEAVETWTLALTKSRLPPSSVEVIDREVQVVLPDPSRGGVVPPPTSLPDGYIPHISISGDNMFLTPGWPAGSTFDISGAHIRFKNLRGNEEVTLGDLVFRGDGRLDVSFSLWSPSFERRSADEAPPRVRLTGGQLIEAAGPVRLSIERGRGLISGSSESSRVLRLESLSVANHAEIELDNVDVFGLQNRDLDALTRSRRIKLRLPVKAGLVDRAEVRKRGLRMNMGVEHRGVAARRLAHFWSAVHRVVRENGDDGPTLSAVRELAFESRRLAASVTSPERLLLEVSRAFGHASRIWRPIWLFGMAVVIAALGFRFTVDGAPGLLGLVFDLVLAPISFLRPLGEATTINDVVAKAGGSARAAIEGVRLLGTTCLVFLAFAVRSYTRLGG